MNLQSRIAKLEKRLATEEAQATSRSLWAAEVKSRAESNEEFTRGWQEADAISDRLYRNQPLTPEEEASLVEAHRLGEEWMKENWGDQWRHA